MYNFMFNYLPFVSVVGNHFDYYYFLLLECTLNAKQTITIQTPNTSKALMHATGHADMDGANVNITAANDTATNGKEGVAGVGDDEHSCKHVIDNNKYKTLDKIYYYINTREV